MDPGNKADPITLLKDGCRLTGSPWAGLIGLEADHWSILSIFKDRSIKNPELAEKISTKINFVWEQNPSSITKLLPVRAPEQKYLACKKILFLPTAAGYALLVGFDGAPARDAKLIWSMISRLLPAGNNSADESQVDLLQNTVLELQLTQQELQARISAQREAEIRLIQAAKLAAVGEMAAGVAHELNNPLTTVVGFTELVLDDLPEESSLRNDLELVLKEARRAGSVVRRLLDFSRQSETVRVKADIQEVIEDVLMLSKHMMNSNGVQLETEYEENLRWAVVDRNQIKQVAINLINNAIYAMPAGGKILVKTAQQSRYGRDWVTFAVQDTGVGIPPENLEKIFEPFFTTRGDRGGTGLGLSVTYGIVTDHGGMIEVESQVNVGSTFIVWLPLDESA